MNIILEKKRHSSIKVPEAERFASKSQIQFRGKDRLIVCY